MRHMIRMGVVGLAVGLVGQWGGLEAAWAQEQRMRGEVVDPALYLKEGRHGADAEEDTVASADGGQTLAFLEDASGTLYLLLAPAPGEDPNELAYDYVNKPVNVTGTVYERGGLRGIALSSVEEVGAAEGAPESPDSTASTPASTTEN